MKVPRTKTKCVRNAGFLLQAGALDSFAPLAGQQLKQGVQAVA